MPSSTYGCLIRTIERAARAAGEIHGPLITNESIVDALTAMKDGAIEPPLMLAGTVDDVT